MNNKIEEYDGYKMPEKQGFASDEEKAKAYEEHEKRMIKILKGLNKDKPSE